MQNEERLHDMKVQLTTVQGNHKESMEQLGEKSQQVAMLKNEISRMSQQNQSLSDDVSGILFSGVFFCLSSFQRKKCQGIVITDLRKL